jgi:hypothetical protein
MNPEELEKIKNIRNTIIALKIEQDIQYEQLRKSLGVTLHSTPDEWLFDAIYNSETEEQFMKTIESFVASR